MATSAGTHQSIEILTRRRERIVWMTEQRGMFAREIAGELGLCLRTVQRHQAAHHRGIAPKHPGPQNKR